MKVTVTQDHIDEGEEFDDSYCPIALAIKQQTKETAVSVSDVDCIVGDKMYRLPNEACDFVVDFDMGEPVEPFEFEMELI